MSSDPDRSYWRPCTLVVQSSTTLFHGPAQSEGGVSVPVKFRAAPPAGSFDRKWVASVSVQECVGGLLTGGSAVTGFCELISTCGCAAAPGTAIATEPVTVSPVMVSRAAANSPIRARVRFTAVSTPRWPGLSGGSGEHCNGRDRGWAPSARRDFPPTARPNRHQLAESARGSRTDFPTGRAPLRCHSHPPGQLLRHVRSHPGVRWVGCLA